MVSEGGLARMREPDLDAIEALLDHRRDRLDFGGELLTNEHAHAVPRWTCCWAVGGACAWGTCSILYRLNRSSYVISDMASPRWPYRPDRPMRCKYVSEFLGKSKLITTLTAWMSMPRVNRSGRDG